MAEEAARHKLDKYEDVAATQQARFLPFAVETTGALSASAIKLVEQITLACRDHLPLPRHFELHRHIMATVAIAVQRANALAVLSGYSSTLALAGSMQAA